jgi:hypothetical protein
LHQPATRPESVARRPHRARPLHGAGYDVEPAGAGLSPRAFTFGVAACATAVAAFVLVQLTAWPPHEDETLALFVGRSSVGDLFGIVLGDRGGAPLHFVLAWIVAHSGGGLDALRLVSAFFAVASVPVLALLCARLTDRTVGLAATALASASWVLLFHGVYGRMYSLFLFTSALSYLALLHAVERGGRRAWSLWTLAVLATVATHPYGALVLASQGVFVLIRQVRVREAIAAFAAVGILGIPFWRSDLVLAGRFDVGVGTGGEKLGGPLSLLRYLRQVAGDFSAGYAVALPAVLALAAFGFWTLWRRRRETAVLTAVVFATPCAALLLAKLGSDTSPESRHLIFAVPFFTALVAAGLVAVPRLRPRLSPALALVGVAALLSSEVGWAWHKTPPLFTGEPALRVEGREAASAWLARTSRPDDVLFGYDPLFLGAWERSARVSRTVVPRADARLALDVLTSTRKPLGRGVWVFDASDTNNFVPHLRIPLRFPSPRSQFEARVFGPFLVIRTLRPTLTPRNFLEQARRVMLVGKSLYMGDADVNMQTVERAVARLD